jgi:hypothetical protein
MRCRLMLRPPRQPEVSHSTSVPRSEKYTVIMVEPDQTESLRRAADLGRCRSIRSAGPDEVRRHRERILFVLTLGEGVTSCLD